MSISPRQFGRMAMFYLTESVLDVLVDHHLESGGGLGAAEISRRSGIYRERGPSNIMNDAIVTGVLNYLHDQGRVARVEQEEVERGGWRLSDAEFERRREDV